MTSLKEFLQHHGLRKDIASLEAEGYIKELEEQVRVDLLGMFAYQGPPSEHWINTKGQFWEGWNKGLDKILSILRGETN